jgi:hypothetical protein
MNDDAARSETATLRGLGGKIGIATLATPDFDLVYANALAVEKFCDQFGSIELTPKERFYFMQLIVASLDEALRRRVPCARELEERVERLLARDLVQPANLTATFEWGPFGKM